MRPLFQSPVLQTTDASLKRQKRLEPEAPESFTTSLEKLSLNATNAVSFSTSQLLHSRPYLYEVRRIATDWGDRQLQV